MSDEDAMWHSGLLHLPESIWQCYETVLKSKGKLNDCKAGSGTNNIHGGPTLEETLQHFVHRFANSCARLCYVIENPKSDVTATSEALRTSFSYGTVFVLDLAGGTGAGMVGLLGALAEERRNNKHPQLPLNVSIHAADISPSALQIYTETLSQMRAPLSDAGILVDLKNITWDALEIAQTSKLCDDWLYVAGDCELIVLISNFTGCGKLFLSKIERSIFHVTERIANKNSTFVWIENSNPGAVSLLDTFASKLSYLTKWLKLKEKISVNFNFNHKIQENKILSCGVAINHFRRDIAFRS